MLVASSLLCALVFADVRSQCTKRADLTITAPQKMRGLSNSCLEIPCSFTSTTPGEFNDRRATTGVWIKNDSRFQNSKDSVIFNSSNQAIGYPMKFTGNLKERNCTTLFSNVTSHYSDKYFFRIENRPFMATASCHPLEIEVRDSPPSPQINISGALRENESVTVTCTAVVPCPDFPPRLTWNLHNVSSQTFRNTDGVLQTHIHVRMTLSDEHDGLSVACTASYPVQRSYRDAMQSKTLDVNYAPKNTRVSVSPQGPLPAGSWVILRCSSRAKPPISKFTWFRSSQDGGGAKTTVSFGAVYTFNFTDGGDYWCEAKNDVGAEESKIRLTIQGQKKTSSVTGIVAASVVVMLLLVGVAATLVFRSRLATSRRRQPPAQESSPTVKSDDIHYGEIDFLKCRPERTSGNALNSRGQQRTLHAQEVLYAPVKINR